MLRTDIFVTLSPESTQSFTQNALALLWTLLIAPMQAESFNDSEHKHPLKPSNYDLYGSFVSVCSIGSKPETFLVQGVPVLGQFSISMHGFSIWK